jgi:hypothetical protein
MPLIAWLTRFRESEGENTAPWHKIGKEGPTWGDEGPVEICNKSNDIHKAIVEYVDSDYNEEGEWPIFKFVSETGGEVNLWNYTYWRKL